MKPVKNIWANDLGFLWMLIISLVSLVSTQLDTSLIGENRMFLRISLFLFTVIAIRSSALSRSGKWLGVAFACLMLLFAWLQSEAGDHRLIVLYSIVSTGFLFFIVYLMVKQIFSGGSITVLKVLGGIATYIVLGHVWATLYHTLYLVNPNAFHYQGEPLSTSGVALKHLSYFSFVTLTTVGYGDLLAVSNAARILSMIEGLVGQLFPAVFIAKLVALQIEHAKTGG